MNERWRLDELVQLVGRALDAAAYEGQTSGRVRDVPDARTIRYYTSLGVLDRPLEMRGRTAYYGRRHLLQIVAIKRLQAHGMPLVDIQKNVTGADHGSLNRWAALPAGFWEAVVGGQESPAAPATPDDVLASGTRASPTGDRARFWEAEPAVAGSAEAVSGSGNRVVVRPGVVLTFGPGVSLVIEGERVPQLDPNSLDAIQPALNELLAALTRAGVLDRDACEGRSATQATRGDHHGS